MGRQDKEIAMTSSSRLGCKTAANICNMMERLGIDEGCRVDPRFGLLFSCALRNCRSCTACDACSEWLANGHDDQSWPPKFCLNFDLLSELLRAPGIGNRTHSAR